MPIPTTNTPGYKELVFRTRFALTKLQEQTWLEFKESNTWQALKWTLLRTVMAMANLRDGGLVIVGVSERDGSWNMKGITQDHMSTFDSDVILDLLDSYASPHVNLDVVSHTEDECQFLVFNVHPFDRSPVVCKKDSVGTGATNRVLETGAIYVRPVGGRPRTSKISSSEELHELLELAAENRARSLLETSRRVGLKTTPEDEDPYKKEIDDFDRACFSTTLPVWRVRFRPLEHDPNRLKNLAACAKIIEKCRVTLRGWDFPASARLPGAQGQGSNWISMNLVPLGVSEFWRLYLSGHFALSRVPYQVDDSRGREWIRKVALEHLQRRDIDLSKNRGFLLIEDILCSLTEYFEFLLRLCQAEVYTGSTIVSIGLGNVNDVALTAGQNRAWWEYYSATEPELLREDTIDNAQIVSESRDLALDWTIWFLERFGWFDCPRELFKDEQVKLLSRKY